MVVQSYLEINQDQNAEQNVYYSLEFYEAVFRVLKKYSILSQDTHFMKYDEVVCQILNKAGFNFINRISDQKIIFSEGSRTTQAIKL